jgi:heptose-I-phosphate ethanolaminephosphotransferase
MFIVLLLLFVQLVLLILNPTLFDFREIVLYLVWLPILYLPYILSKSRLIYYIVTAFIVGLISANFLHLIITSRPFTAASFFIFTNSNINEMSEFTDTVKLSHLLFVIPYLYLVYKSFSRVPIINLSIKRNTIVIGLLLLFSIVFIAENVIGNRFLRKGLNNESRVWINIYAELKQYNSLKKRQAIEVPITIKDTTLKSEIIVMIIGESLNRNHMSLYGYDKNTNPLLSKRDDIVVFNDIISKYTNTLSSVMNFYTKPQLNNPNESITLIDIFKSAGYNTYWISNQSPLGIWDNAIFNIASTAQHKYFVNQSGNNSQETLFQRSYDENLLPIFQKVLGKEKYQFITIHLMGSHTKYAYRYPEKYNVFKSAHTDKQQTINEYDNSVVYNDYVVNQFIELIRQVDNVATNVTMLYLSDHGENVYDFNDIIGHNFESEIHASLVEVPYVIWTNNSVLNEKYRKLSSLPGTVEHVFYNIQGLSNVSSDIYDVTKDMCNKEYEIPLQRILENGKPYKK